jgi:hypothetical protein
VDVIFGGIRVVDRDWG